MIYWRDEAELEQGAGLLRVWETAKAGGEPRLFQLGEKYVTVSPKGFGCGRQSHMEFCVKWPCALLGLSFRPGDKRLLSNFHLKVEGFGCLSEGVQRVHCQALAIVKILGGDFYDEWPKRVDICLDVPGLDYGEWMGPAVYSDQQIGRLRGRSQYGDIDDPTGFKIGSRQGLSLRVYDKLRETLKSSRPEYVQAMKQNRWGDVIPRSATRIEYEIRKAWLDQFDIRTSRELWRRLPDVVAKITQTGAGSSFCLTDGLVNREQKHQSRATTHPLWQELMDEFQRLSGEPQEPLQRIDRSELDCMKAIKQAVGVLISVAAKCGCLIQGADMLVEFFREILLKDEIDDGYCYDSYLKHAERHGTLGEPVRFGLRFLEDDVTWAC